MVVHIIFSVYYKVTPLTTQYPAYTAVFPVSENRVSRGLPLVYEVKLIHTAQKQIVIFDKLPRTFDT